MIVVSKMVQQWNLSYLVLEESQFYRPGQANCNFLLCEKFAISLPRSVVWLSLRENVHHIEFNHKISSQMGNFHGILDYYTILECLFSGLLKSHLK